MTDVHVDVVGQVMQVTLDGPDSQNRLTPDAPERLAALSLIEQSTPLRLEHELVMRRGSS